MTSLLRSCIVRINLFPHTHTPEVSEFFISEFIQGSRRHTCSLIWDMLSRYTNTTLGPIFLSFILAIHFFPYIYSAISDYSVKFFIAEEYSVGTKKASLRFIKGSSQQHAESWQVQKLMTCAMRFHIQIAKPVVPWGNPDGNCFGCRGLLYSWVLNLGTTQMLLLLFLLFYYYYYFLFYWRKLQ